MGCLKQFLSPVVVIESLLIVFSLTDIVFSILEAKAAIANLAFSLFIGIIIIGKVTLRVTAFLFKHKPIVVMISLNSGVMLSLVIHLCLVAKAFAST